MDFQKFVMDPKDATRILFGASGKLSPIEFAQGLVAIVAISVVMNILTLAPGIGGLIGLLSIPVGLVLAFAWVCIFSKRFHDAGQSGWMTVVAILAVVIIMIVLGMILNPIFGIRVTTDFTALAMMGPAMILKNIVTMILANGAAGYYMYNLKPAAEG